MIAHRLQKWYELRVDADIADEAAQIIRRIRQDALGFDDCARPYLG